MFPFSYVEAKKKIFVLHSYAQEYPWTKQQHTGFLNHIKNEYKAPLEILTEHLDTKRVLFDSKYKQSFIDYLRFKYNDYKVDAIYVTDDNALNFFKENENNIFIDAPIFFSGVNNLSIQNKLNKKRFSGVFETKEIIPNIELIRTFSPQTKVVYFLGDNSKTYSSIETKIKSDISTFKNINFVFVADQSIDKVINELNRLTSERTFIILTTVGSFIDEKGKNLTLQESISKITAFDNFIVMSMEDAYMYPGVVGGYVTDGLKQGEYAAKMVLESFEGKNLEHIDYLIKSPNTYMFDQQSLNNARFFLATNIKEDVVIVKQNDDFYIKYNEIILNTLFLLSIILSTSLIVAYLIVKEKNKKIVKNSKEIEEKKGSQINRHKNYNKRIQLGHWDWDLRNKKIECSNGIYQIFEISKDMKISSYNQLIGFIYSEDKKLVNSFIQDCLKNKKRNGIEHRIQLSNNQVKKVHHQIDLQMDNLGNLIHLFGTIHDLTNENE